MESCVSIYYVYRKESNSDKCSVHSRLFSEPLARQKVGVPCQCPTLLSLEWWCQDVYPGTRKGRAEQPLVKPKLAMFVLLPVRLNSAEEIIHSPSWRCCAFMFPLPRLAVLLRVRSHSSSSLPENEQTVPCSSLSTNIISPFEQTKTLGPSLTPLSTPPSVTWLPSPIVSISFTFLQSVHCPHSVLALIRFQANNLKALLGIKAPELSKTELGHVTHILFLKHFSVNFGIKSTLLKQKARSLNIWPPFSSQLHLLSLELHVPATLKPWASQNTP